jgi:cytosine/adenosine deaminase-related metal-dependent hydrolase
MSALHDWADRAADAMADDAAKQWSAELRVLLEDNVRAETWRQLVAECVENGTTANAAHRDWIAEHGATDADAFVAICAECNLDLWRARYESVMDEEIEAWEAQQ